MRALVCLLTIAVAGAAAQVVEGSILNSVSGNGIPGVKVEMLRSEKPAYTLTTDATGHFRAENVEDGGYTVRYWSPEYWPSDPGYPLPATGMGTYPAFQMTAGSPAVKLELHMAPYPKISGRVLDDRGNGVANAEVHLNGTGSGTIRTDAQGKFEIHSGIVPGEYVLGVDPPAGLKPPVRPPDDDRVRAWAHTWYPGVTQAEAASKIVLPPGGEVRDVEVRLQAPFAHALRGVMLNADGKPAENIEIRLSQGPTYPAVASTRSKADGTFEMPAVVDGAWILAAGSGTLQARKAIQMAGSKIEGVQMHLSAPFMLRGKVVMERPEGAPQPKMPSVLLAPHPGPLYDGRGGMVISGPNESAGADGNFALKEVYPGLYGVYSWFPAPGYYLDAIRVGDAEITAAETEFAGPIPITVVYKSDGGSVRGTVEKCGSGRVMLVPLDTARQLPQYMRVTNCDAADRYEFPDVRPGDYYAVAVPQNVRIDFGKLDYGLLNQAGRVTVRTGEASAADLHPAGPQ